MFDTTLRILAPPNKTSTNEKVGPGTYVLCHPPSKKQSYAPFLSKQIRKPSFFTRSFTDAVYDTRSCYGTVIKGGASMKNKAPRFSYKPDGVPGPTRYNTKPLQWIKKKLELDPTKPKIYVCPVPYTLTCVAPTIPTKIDENGYDIDEDGNIVKVPADAPDCLDLNLKPLFPKENGCQWSGRTSKRFSKKQYCSPGPGPAGYTVQIPECRCLDDEDYIREMARRFTFIPRYIEGQELKIAREDLPGPGHYDIGKPPSDRAKSINPRPFISNAGRFKGSLESTPSPNKYKICDCYRVQKQFSVKCTHFGVEADRFSKRKPPRMPGPGDYEIKSALQEKIDSKINRYSSIQPPFNSTRERTMYENKEAKLKPSPAEYPALDREIDDGIREIDASVFKSNVERFFSLRDKKDGLSPNRYHYAESFEKTRDRKSFSVSKLPFYSSGIRSTTPKAKFGVPCSTTYKNEHGLNELGHHFNTSPRFGRPAWARPGPGTYVIHPGFDESMFKAWKTHNLKLKENVLRSKLRVPPSETRKCWLRMLKKKKLLEWFNVGPDFEERMAALIFELFDKPL